MTYYVMSGDAASRFMHPALAVAGGSALDVTLEVTANHMATGLRPRGSIRLLINSFPKFHYLPKIAEPDVRSSTSGVPNAWSSFLLAKLETHWVQIKRRIGYSYFHGCYGVWILQAYLYQQPLTGSEL